MKHYTRTLTLFLFTSVLVGQPTFTEHVISTSADNAPSVYAADVEGDGDMDVLSASYEDDKIAWYENDGSENFTEHDISTAATHPNSVYAADVDSDGDLDVVVTSMFNDWENPNAKSIIWLENNGEMQFARRDITGTPTPIKTAIEADFNGDGKIDFITGGRYTDPPYEHMERILLWSNHWPAAPISSR